MQQIKIENEILKIKNVEKENLIWKWITRIGGLFGVLLTAFLLYQALFPKAPEISARMIGFTQDAKKTYRYFNSISGDSVEFKGYKYLLMLSINVSKEDLNFQNIDVEIKYSNGITDTATNFNPNTNNKYFNIWKYSKRLWKLEIPWQDILLYKSSFAKNTTQIGYMAVVIEDSKNNIPPTRPESFRLLFTESKNEILHSTNIITWDSTRILESMYDHDIWTDLTQMQKSQKEIIGIELQKKPVDDKINIFIKPEDKAEFLKYFEGFIQYVHNDALLKKGF